MATSCSPHQYNPVELTPTHALAIISGMNDLAALARMIEKPIRFDTIPETRITPPRARIMTTGWLLALAHR